MGLSIRISINITIRMRISMMKMRMCIKAMGTEGDGHYHGDASELKAKHEDE